MASQAGKAMRTENERTTENGGKTRTDDRIRIRI